MSIWKLPEALGGGEFEALTQFYSTAGGQHRLRFNIPGIGLVDVPFTALTEVKPPLEEPPPGPYIARDGEGVQMLVERVSDDWYVSGVKGKWTFGDMLNDYTTFTRLVPAPPPVELPWEWRAMQVKVTSPPTRVFMRVVAYHSYFEPDDADALAAALVAAAAEVREAAS